MTLCTGGFETGTVGNTIATSDTGDATAWNTVSIAGSGGTATYEGTIVAVGAKSAKLTTPATAGQTYVEWIAALGTVTDHYGSFYVYQPTLIAAQAGVNIRNGAGGAAAKVFLTASGKVQLQDSAGTIATGNVSVVANQWAFIEYHVVHSATVGYVEARLYVDAASNTLSEIIAPAAANANTNTQADRVRFGNHNNTSNLTHYFDSIRAGASAYSRTPSAGGMLLTGVG